MAAQITLVRGASTLDMLLNTDKIELAENGWIRTVARRGVDGQWPSSVPEALLHRIDADDHDDLAAVVQSVNEFMRQAGDFIEDPTDDNPVFLRTQLTDESNPYQALIQAGLMEPDASFFGCPVDEWAYLPEATLELTRNPFWEPTSSTSFNASGMDAGGDTHDYGGTPIPGDVPGRVSELIIIEENGGDVVELNEFWIGFRTNRFGTRGNFVPEWPLEDASTLSNNTTAPGAYIRWTPTGAADETMKQRAIIAIEDVTSDYADQRGRFLVLLRALSTGTRTFRVQMATGLLEGDIWDTKPRVVIDKGDYYFYPLGEISFPIASRLIEISESAAMRAQSIQISAEVGDAGTGNLDMERLVLIPINEGFAHFKGLKAIEDVSDVAYLVTQIDGAISAEIQKIDGVPKTVDYPVYDDNNWAIPPGAGLIVFAAQGVAESRLTDTVRVTVEYLERWLTLGGAG